MFLAVLLSLLVGTAAAFGWVVEVRLRESLERWTVQQLTMVATRAVVSAVAEAGGSGRPGLVRYQTDGRGSVIGIEYDWATINQVAARAAEAVESWLSSATRQDVAIPIGEITGLRTLGGRGPTVRLRLITAGAFEMEPFAEFVAAGFNQTLHRVGLELRVRVLVAAPLVGDTVAVRARVPIVENQVLGQVPAFLMVPAGKPARGLAGTGAGGQQGDGGGRGSL